MIERDLSDNIRAPRLSLCVFLFNLFIQLLAKLDWPFPGSRIWPDVMGAGSCNVLVHLLIKDTSVGESEAR